MFLKFDSIFNFDQHCPHTAVELQLEAASVRKDLESTSFSSLCNLVSREWQQMMHSEGVLNEEEESFATFNNSLCYFLDFPSWRSYGSKVILPLWSC